MDFSIDFKTWPAHARLTCRFAHRPVDQLTDGSAATLPRGLDSLTWRLLEQTASTMGLVVERRDEAPMTALTLEFPRTASTEIAGLSAIEINDGFAPSSNSQPLAGNHVLVITARREMRLQIRDAIGHMGLIIDFVNAVEEAAAFCREGLPHAVIIEAIQTGERFAHWREGISKEVPDFVVIELIEEGAGFVMSSFGGGATARVGRAGLANALPAALMYELSKGL